MNIAKFLRKPISKNICDRLLLPLVKYLAYGMYLFCCRENTVVAKIGIISSLPWKYFTHAIQLLKIYEKIFSLVCSVFILKSVYTLWTKLFNEATFWEIFLPSSGPMTLRYMQILFVVSSQLKSYSVLQHFYKVLATVNSGTISSNVRLKFCCSALFFISTAFWGQPLYTYNFSSFSLILCSNMLKIIESVARVMT